MRVGYVLPWRVCVGADGAVALFTQVMLHLAGVCLGSNFVDTKIDQELCERFVAVEHARGNLHAALGQGNQAVLVHRDIAVFLEPLCGVGDTGLCDAEKFGNVDRADVAVPFLHHQHRFEVVFCCAQNFHSRIPTFFLRIVIS